MNQLHRRENPVYHFSPNNHDAKFNQTPIHNQLDTENYIKSTILTGAQSSNRTKF